MPPGRRARSRRPRRSRPAPRRARHGRPGVREAGKLHDDDVSFRIEPEVLAEDADPEECARRVAGDPPLVAVCAVGVDRPEVAVGQHRRLAAPARGVDPLLGNDLMAVGHAAVQNAPAEPGEIAGGGADSGAGVRGARRIQGDHGVVLGTDTGPDPFADHVRIGLPGGALQHPGEHVGGRRAVLEAPPVRAVGLQAGQKGPHTVRVPVVLGPPARRPVTGLHLRLRIVVILTKPQRRGHVQHLAHRRRPIRRRREFRNVCLHRGRYIQHPVGHQTSRGHAGDRLGDRHQRVPTVRRRLAVVALEQHLFAAQHDDRVGRRPGKELSHRRGAFGRRDHRFVQLRPGRGEPTAAGPAARDHRGAEQPFHMIERPAVGRRFEPVFGRGRAFEGWLNRCAHGCGSPGLDDVWGDHSVANPNHAVQY